MFLQANQVCSVGDKVVILQPLRASFSIVATVLRFETCPPDGDILAVVWNEWVQGELKVWGDELMLYDQWRLLQAVTELEA